MICILIATASLEVRQPARKSRPPDIKAVSPSMRYLGSLYLGSLLENVDMIVPALQDWCDNSHSEPM